MINRMVMAAIVAAGVASMLVPFEASARSGASFAGRSMLMDFHPVGGRPFRRPPIAHIDHDAAVAPRHAAVRARPVHAHFFRVTARRHHRPFGSAFPFAWAGDSPLYGSSYDPSDDTGTYDPPGTEPADTDEAPYGGRPPLPVHRPGCYSQTQLVPSRGGERPVTITRCW